MANSSRHYHTPRLGDIVLLFGGFSNAKVNINNLRSNGTYIYEPPRDRPRWKDILAKVGVPANSAIFCLVFSRKPKDRRAWVFGSTREEDAADFWLHTGNSSGISRRHLSIGLAKTGSSVVPEIKCLSKSGLIIKRRDKIITLGQEDTHKIFTPVRLLLAEGQSFWAWSPDRSPQQESLFRKNVEVFARDLNMEPPLYIPSIDSGFATLDGDCRCGQDGSFYRRKPWYKHSSGATASTFRVDKDGEEMELLAKEPHYKNQPEISAFVAAEMLENEFKALMKFQHPHVVTPYDFAKHVDGVSAMHPPWLILEKLPYELSEAPRNDPVALTVDILSGVQAVHFAGCIHRDLKPDNVRATKHTLSDGSDKWSLKICDLGSVALQTTVDKGFAGTPNYIAPEIWKDRKRYDELVDVFSLGIIALMLFTPYTAEQHAEERLSSYDDVVWWVVEVAVPLVQEAPQLYQPLLYGMLALEPKDRWGTQKCMSYLSYLSLPRTTCDADNRSEGNRPNRKRKYEPSLEDAADDLESGNARMVRPKLEHDGETITPALSTTSYDGTFYTAPVIQSGGLEGSGPSNISVAANAPDLCNSFYWASVGARSQRPPPKSSHDPALSIPYSYEGRKPDWVDNTPRAAWERWLPAGYCQELVDDGDYYPKSVPVTPRLDEAEVLGKIRAPDSAAQDSEAVLCAGEVCDVCVESHEKEMGEDVFTYVVPMWSNEALARFENTSGELFSVYEEEADLVDGGGNADVEVNCHDVSDDDDDDDGTRTVVPDYYSEAAIERAGLSILSEWSLLNDDWGDSWSTIR
ncbi:hypothetical protein F4802DRAFT_600964 [Xylaria palmicola]|nr:hypothetical protein F4802DRAFT_600964 [Xylaria palmicola]